ncbi:hypothetical protein [Candidatus Paracaedibacter symbiosus]|uniref:hypothetical protein n=1 Tax=Candidatus Paracaedibacter symbiosus TaxID=244582 RepID=UPI00068FDF5E|nr:hypothetical protein [Candidatus Paracaedibacter symbiosus]
MTAIFKIFSFLSLLISFTTVTKATEETMWTRSFSKLYSDVNKEDIWHLWKDVNTWPQWNKGIDYSKMEGPFEVGNFFMLKPKGGNPVKIVLTEVKEGRKFTDCTTFPGAEMYDTHVIEETPEGLLLSNTLVVTGPEKLLWIDRIVQNIADKVPYKMDALVNLARESRSKSVD